jgi:hypothetical protein
MSYQPKTGTKCDCRAGNERDNCATCEGTGWQIDFAAVRAENKKQSIASYGELIAGLQDALEYFEANRDDIFCRLRSARIKKLLKRVG